jgi:hypothetical protein
MSLTSMVLTLEEALRRGCFYVTPEQALDRMADSIRDKDSELAGG